MVNILRTVVPDAVAPTRTWRRSLVAVLVIFAAACGSGESPISDSGSTAKTEPDSGTIAGSDTDSAGGLTDSTSELATRLSVVDLPPDAQVSTTDDQTAALDGVSYLVTARADGMRLVAVTAGIASDTDAVIAGGLSAKVFNSGSRIVMTGSDGSGNLAVLSSEDGETYAEALIPIPARYVDADVWDATSLIADVLGAADLNGDIFLIAALGIRWPSDLDVVARHAYTISEEVGDAARFAGIIRQVPQGDGDFLYTFERDGEVVFKALGSEAGLEPGYREAVKASLGDDTLVHGGWIISGSTATQTTNPPIDGQLDGDMRLNSLYPVKSGVAALVTDFSPEASESQEDASDGGTVLISDHPGQTVTIQSGTGAILGVQHSWDGELWQPAGGAIGQPNGPVPIVVADVESETFGMLTTLDDSLSLRKSGDGLDWDVPEWPIDVTLQPGQKLELSSLDENFVVTIWTTNPDLFPLEISDGDFEQIIVWATVESGYGLRTATLQLDERTDVVLVGTTLGWGLRIGVSTSSASGLFVLE